MSARVPRSRFASPFVITLAATPACVVSTGDSPSTDPPTTTATPTADAHPQSDPPASDPPVSDPRPRDPGSGAEPTTTVAETKPQRWSLLAQGDQCVTQLVISCEQKPGDPPRSCNPPPPQTYPCPTYNDGSKIQVGTGATIHSDGQGHCSFRPPMGKCPQGAMCNPPPPREVPCPK